MKIASLASMEREFRELRVTGLDVEFSKLGLSYQSTRLFSNGGLHDRREGKDDQCIDMGFLLIAEYVDRETG